ncbi:disulfide oxidoreductase [Ornithinibacillus contaminans]|uniref:disulfide oxidoreductase n=1 Tax=Ornithinibacillus contaminans TaxID=694055 RepID=UPI00064DAB89|nr:disulfide oxidoreductase [Ornithinibacillus contaminans]
MKKWNNEKLVLILLYFSWITSIIATIGSLYFSEIKGFVPCELCWYQRIFMYPVPIILGIATFFKDFSVIKYVLPLSILGNFISLYHYLLQKIPGLIEIKPCHSGVPCNLEYINVFGFITIPLLSFISFTVIVILLSTIYKSYKSI